MMPTANYTINELSNFKTINYVLALEEAKTGNPYAKAVLGLLCYQEDRASDGQAYFNEATSDSSNWGVAYYIASSLPVREQSTKDHYYWLAFQTAIRLPATSFGRQQRNETQERDLRMLHAIMQDLLRNKDSRAANAKKLILMMSSYAGYAYYIDAITQSNLAVASGLMYWFEVPFSAYQSYSRMATGSLLYDKLSKNPLFFFPVIGQLSSIELEGLENNISSLHTHLKLSKGSLFPIYQKQIENEIFNMLIRDNTPNSLEHAIEMIIQKNNYHSDYRMGLDLKLQERIENYLVGLVWGHFSTQEQDFETVKNLIISQHAWAFTFNWIHIKQIIAGKTQEELEKQARTNQELKFQEEKLQGELDKIIAQTNSQIVNLLEDLNKTMAASIESLLDCNLPNKEDLEAFLQVQDVLTKSLASSEYHLIDINSVRLTSVLTCVQEQNKKLNDSQSTPQKWQNVINSFLEKLYILLNRSKELTATTSFSRFAQSKKLIDIQKFITNTLSIVKERREEIDATTKQLQKPQCFFSSDLKPAEMSILKEQKIR